MSGDYSRDTFDALRDHAAVFLQQGRAALDADWNETVRIFERRIRAGTVDTIGRAVVPRETETGFEIQLAAGPTLEIGRGRMYLDGMLIECHGAANFPESGDTDFPAPVFDRGREETDGPEGVLDELISAESGDFLPYDRQPYWPVPNPLPQSAGPHLAYVVAWQREVTPLENPALLEPALGGIDTATRWQTVWQVRVLPDVGANATCATPDDQLDGWQAEIAPSTARLTTTTIDIEDPEDPCLVPPTDGYTGIENQFYRVELHLVGDTQGDARFKFSRENASVAAAIESFANPADRISVRRIGRDEILRFRAGDWVEITDDRRELDHRSGQMLRVARVHEETREIELEGTVDADFVPSGIGEDTVTARRSRVIRWDQRGVILLDDGTQWADLDDDLSDGLIPVPSDGRAIVLESGITVSFSTAPGAGSFREMDYWRFAARTAGTQIEELEAAPPEGIQRHYGRLAIVTFPASRLDCRVFWPPDFGGEAESCACTVCVTPESHNSGALTIQAAVDQIGPQGGTVCLEGGGYILEEPVSIAGHLAITVRGQGLATVLLYRGEGAAIRVSASVDVQVERLSVLVLPLEDDAGSIPEVAGLSATHSAFLALRRLAVLVATSGENRQDHGIAIEGVAIGAKVEECLVLAPVALGSASAIDPDRDGPGFVIAAEVRVLDNILFGARAAVRFEGIALNIAGAIFSRNLMLGEQAGAVVTWFEPPTGSTALEANTALSNGDGLRLGATDLRLQDNEISGGAQIGDGVRLVAGPLSEIESDAQVIGNRIGDLAGAGLRIEGALGALMVKRNVIRRCGTAGILTGPDASIRHAAIDNNVIEEIADAADIGAAGAIVLTRMESGEIADNAIRAVGLGGPTGGIFAGIAVQGVGSIGIERNSVAEIGPDSSAAPAVAILARSPYAGLSVRGNRLAGSQGDVQIEDRQRGWMGLDLGRGGAVAVGVPPGVGLVPGFAAGEVAYAEVAGRAYMVSLSHLSDLGAIRERQVTVSDNQMYHATESGLPMVLIGETSAATVLFCQNQCRLQAIGSRPALVIIQAARVIASNNAVRRQSDLDAMDINVGEAGRATVLGNITFGNIRLQPGGLQPPFNALNLLSS
jgi:Family of unknown function (DUF6519)